MTTSSVVSLSFLVLVLEVTVGSKPGIPMGSVISCTLEVPNPSSSVYRSFCTQSRRTNQGRGLNASARKRELVGQD